MQEIADWLTRLGLPGYAGAFAENGIDVSVLPNLTDFSDVFATYATSASDGSGR
jgi:SAM domain (Sterile alpha motif)